MDLKYNPGPKEGLYSQAMLFSTLSPNVYTSMQTATKPPNSIYTSEKVESCKDPNSVS